MAFKARETVGLDIGSRVVKAVQLRKSGQDIELAKFGLAEIFPTGDRPSSSEDQRQARIDAIRKALQDGNITSKQAVTAVSGESVIVRYIQLPDMPEAELKGALRWEAEEYIPFNMEDVNIDSSIIGAVEGSDTPLVDVLLVCARKDLINEHISLVQEAGLSPVVIDVDSFAFLNCFELNYQPDPNDVIGLVNMGGDITSISVYSGGSPRFSRDISIGGNTITAAIQQRLEVPLPDAEALKVQRGVPAPADGQPAAAGGEDMGLMETIRSTVESMTDQPAEDDASEMLADRAIRNTLNSLIGEIRRSLQFFETQSRGLEVGRLVIGGGTAHLDGLEGLIHSELQLPVETIDPLRRIPPSGRDVDPELLRRNKLALSVGIGLALRKVVD